MTVALEANLDDDAWQPGPVELAVLREVADPEFAPVDYGNYDGLNPYLAVWDDEWRRRGWRSDEERLRMGR